MFQELKTDRRRPLRHVRAGAVTVEFALTLPIMLLLVLGIMEFGRAMMVEQMLTNAAREAARCGVLDGSSDTEVRAAVADYLATGGIAATDVTITIDPADLTAARKGTAVSVELSVPYNSVSWVPTPWFLGNTTLSSECVMRHE
ncbi:MAG: pilus assembly protein [Planctomycetes bacterium]|nr:pilus assembly protein [Planctomycetota bacterium]